MSSAKVRNLGEGKTLSRIAKIRSRSLSNSALSQGERRFVNSLSWERGRGEGDSSFAKQTKTNSSHKRSFASLKMTSVGHSEQREESHKLDCFTPSHKTILNRFVRQSVRNDETPLVPQCLSALVPSKKVAFTLAEGATHVAQPKNVGKAAFTLAEVLVTLGIIGVVSAMTLPTLVKNHQRKVFVTQLHKVYNEFSQAGEAYITSRNAINLSEAGLRSAAGIQNFVASQFKTVKSCGSTFTDCFASEYQNMNGATITNYSNSNASCYVLPTGASVCLAPGGATTTGVLTTNLNFVDLIVDTNGKQGPNILGRDLFIMAMANDGSVVPSRSTFESSIIGGSSSSTSNSDLEKCQSATSISAIFDGRYCFTQLQNDGWQMNY